jgi:aminopeptidase-like protein/aminoglycoside N3'-acetyltransferase
MYTKDEFIDALIKAGVSKGDIIMVHVGMSSFGAIPKEVRSQEQLSLFVLDSIIKVLGPTGTLVVPAFSYSLGKGEIFDAKTTPCPLVGEFCEFFRKQPNVYRSNDPFLSVSAIGPKAKLLTENISNSSYGKNSFFDKFTKEGGKIVCLGVGLRYATIRHYYEEMANVPFRYLKFFNGHIIKNDIKTKCCWYYSVSPRCNNTYPLGIKLEEIVEQSGLMKKIPLCKGYISCIKSSDYLEIALREYRKDPWLCAKGPKCDIAAEEKSRTGSEHFNIKINSTDIIELANKLAPIPRYLISDGYDESLFALKSVFNIKIHEYKSGEEAYTWTVPERWICKEAYVKDLNGKTIISNTNSPLSTISYSKSIDQIVEKKELLSHIYTPNPKRNSKDADAIPFIFKYYEKDWGFCVTSKIKKLIEESIDDKFYVKINSDFSFSTLKVGEFVVEGKSKECIVLCAHLCHPCQFNDGLSGVIAGLKVIESLSNLKLRYTYKLLIVPETIGSVCYLSHNEDHFNLMRGGIFLESLATDYKHTIMSSNQPESYFDKLCKAVTIGMDIDTVPFLAALLNDERMFNAPGINVPMISLQRIAETNDSEYPFRYYHTNMDTPEHANFANLEDSILLLKRIIDAHEKDFYVTPLFKGELFISRFSEIDYSKYGSTIRKIIYELITPKQISQISININENFFKVKEILDLLVKYNLVEYK